MLRAHVIRCNGHMVNGGRCKREAEPGSVVCRLHGGAAPQVRKRAAERLIMSADHVSQKLLEWLDDPEVPYRVRAEIAQDLLDRAGLIATQVHQIIPTTEDPIMRFFEVPSATRTTGRRTRLSQPSRSESSTAQTQASRRRSTAP